MKEQTERRGIFYGWWIVLAGTVVMALQSGVYFYGFSAFFNPLIAEFGWSRTALSGAFSLARLEGGIAGPIVGFLIDKFGPRILMIVGFGLAGMGFIVLSQINSIEMFYVVFVLLLSFGSSLGFGPPINAAVANWFSRRRSFAFGIMTCGVGAGGVTVPVLAWAIEQFGWRSAAIGSGLLFLVLAPPLAFVMRHRPEQYGYLPDGARPVVEEEKKPQPAEATTGKIQAESSKTVAVDPSTGEVSFTARQALATSAFWMLSFAFMARMIVAGGVGVHEIPALEHIGYSPEAAASVLAAMTLISIPGRLFFGWLGDRYDKRYVVGICLMMQFLGLIAFAYATNLFLIVVFLLVYSPAYGGLVPLLPAMYGEYFGRKYFATIFGLSQVVTMWGTMSGPLLAGYTFDLSNSYQFAFLFFAVSNLAGIALLFLVRRPRPKFALEGIKT